MKDVYTFKHVGLDDEEEPYVSTKVIRILEEETDIYAVVSSFSEFLLGCGFAWSSVNKVLNLEEE